MIKEKDKVYYTLYLMNRVLDTEYNDKQKVALLLRISNYTFDEVNQYVLNNGLDWIQTLANDIDTFTENLKKEKEQNSN